MQPLPREHHLADHLDTILLSEARIRARIMDLATEIEANESTHPDLTLLVLLHGSLLFAADLMRALSLPLYLESFRVASYHGGTSSSGALTMDPRALAALRGRHVLVVDDILDTGRTLSAVTRALREEAGAASVTSCVLLDKRVARAVEFEADYVGFPIGDDFVVGYGLDFEGRYRNLPYIATLKPEAIRETRR
ncbi:MAG: hypoxanthine phosphoribosyltransferase [Verrucomicrobia bacterium]|nr:hypoxanthine phosphoribosyltransferase [Verrucomicrobiota bacterium]